MRALIGLDQGSTKTHAVVAALDGRLLGVGHAPGALHTVHGMEKALLRMREAAEQALSRAGIGFSDIVAISGGLTGIDYPYEQALLTEAVGGHFGVASVYVHNDCIGALWGGAFAGPAVVCCAGTGLNLGGVSAEGAIDQLGNYANGPLCGASSIGQNALQAIFDAHIKKRPETALTGSVLDALSLPDVDALLMAHYRHKTVRPASLCPLVFDVAGQGDPVAIDLLKEFAQSWAELILSMMARLGIDPAAPVRVVLSGSVFKGKPDIPRRHIEAFLKARAPQAEIVQARYEPVVGGAVMGLFHLGEGNWQANIEQTAGAMGLVREEAS